MPDSHHSIRIERINNAEDPRFHGFASVYKEAFAEPPYLETYTDEQIREDVWVPHIGHGVLVANLATDGSSPEHTVGLACCHGILAPTEPHIRDFVLGVGLSAFFDPERTIFMSELAVLKPFRRQGLGQMLVLERMRWGLDNGFTHYAMRTASEGSHSRRMYERLGASLAPFVQKVAGDGVESASKTRVYLYGSLAHALERGGQN